MNQKTLFGLLSNSKLTALLDIFLESPSLEASQTTLIKKSGISKTTAVKWLSILVSLGLLFIHRIGTTNLYKLNNNHMLIKQLKIMKTLFLLNPLREMHDVTIILYGSCARGENYENSDIDLLLFSSFPREKLHPFIENLSKKIGKSLNYSVFDDITWSMMRKKDPAFYNRVMQDGVTLQWT